MDDIGIIADIHGNLRALKSVIRVLRERRVKRVFCLGDLVGYYHNSLEVLDFIKNNNIECILGNHEGYLLNKLECSPKKWKLYFLDGVKNNLSVDLLRWLDKLPFSLEIKMLGRRMAFFHGSPWFPLTEYVYPDSDNLNKFRDFAWDYVFLGHTHYPMLKKINGLTVFNPGSCGQPRDGEIKAKAGVLNLNSGKLSFIKASYDVEAMINEAEASGVSSEAIQVLKDINEKI